MRDCRGQRQMAQPYADPNTTKWLFCCVSPIYRAAGKPLADSFLHLARDVMLHLGSSKDKACYRTQIQLGSTYRGSSPGIEAEDVEK